MANYLTTRSHALTIEILGQVTTKPFYPGDKYPRKTYRVNTVLGQRHLVLLIDRSGTLRINEDGTCDFTGPIRILSRRWSHVRN
jgi:hypothetical protein